MRKVPTPEVAARSVVGVSAAVAQLCPATRAAMVDPFATASLTGRPTPALRSG
jgi:hypothetical protein